MLINVSWCDLGVICFWMIWCDIIQVRLGLSLFWCGLLSYGFICRDIYLFCSNGCFRCGLGVIWFWMIWCDIIEVSLGLSWFIFNVAWFLMVWFGVIFTFFGSNWCFFMWFECDLLLNDLVWYYWGQFMSELVCFWCGSVSYGVVWCDFYILLFQWMFF